MEVLLHLPVVPDVELVAAKAAETLGKALGMDQTRVEAVSVAVVEACLNAIQHTQKTNINEKIIVEVETIEDALQINIYDRGRGFYVDEARDYDVTEAASHRKTGGMGLHIIRKAMDKVDYEIDPINGNKLVMLKYLN